MTVGDNSPETRKERKRDKRRTEILDAAEQLFFSRPYDDVSMDDIAMAIDLSKPTIYLYFRNKDSLFMHIVFRKLETFGQYAIEQMKKGMTGEQKIRVLIQCFVDFAKENSEYNDFASTNGPSIMRRIGEEDLREMEEIGGRYFPHIIQAIGEGQQDGSIRRDLNAISLGYLIHMITFSVVSPDPGWKRGYEKTVGNYDDLMELYPAFIEPAIAGCPDITRKTRLKGS